MLDLYKKDKDFIVKVLFVLIASVGAVAIIVHAVS
jgi:hypothetical protein